MIETGVLATAVEKFLPQQRWFGAKDRPIAGVDIVSVDVLRDTWPLLMRVEASVRFADRGKGASQRYQVLVGVRPAGTEAEFLRTHDGARLGDCDTDAGPGFAYDALLDPELALGLLSVVAPEIEVTRVRALGAEQSNTSLVYDDRLILKVFRRLEEGPNPDVEVTAALAGLGFTHVAEQVGRWQRDGTDLAVLQRFLQGATDGWALALTSLRDLFASKVEEVPRSLTGQVPVITPDMEAPGPAADVAAAGGDFAGEACRMGEVTADLHVALAEAFGREPGDEGVWADTMDRQLRRVTIRGVKKAKASEIFDRLRDVVDPGPSIRVHGDYHLGQVLRTDAGWYVLDFEGEPARPLAERRKPSSPLKDVAGMLRSFHYAARVAVAEQDDEDVDDVADAWERRNRGAFLDGYLRRAEGSAILPGDEDSLRIVLAAFELDKALYEVGYEQAHRPEWVEVPLAAVRRIALGAS